MDGGRTRRVASVVAAVVGGAICFFAVLTVLFVVLSRLRSSVALPVAETIAIAAVVALPGVGGGGAVIALASALGLRGRRLAAFVAVGVGLGASVFGDCMSRT